MIEIPNNSNIIIEYEEPKHHRCDINASLVKYVLQLATLEFPPKKLFGNKDERVIAERRSHLEVTESSFAFSVCRKLALPLTSENPSS